VQDVVLDLVALSFHKISCPANCWHKIVCSIQRAWPP
jgi:hypothetical protein